MIEKRRKELGNGIGFTILTDPKHKTNTISVNLMSRHTAETAAANAAVAFMIEDTCRKYPTVTEFSKRKGELYGAGVTTGIVRLGDSSVICTGANCIADKYALNGEDITCQTAELLFDCLTDPVTEENCGETTFPKKQFLLKKQELIDNISADINEKRNFALKNSGKIIYRNEPAGIPLKGEISDAEALTSAQVYKAYKEILRTAKIEIVYVGNEISPECEELIEKRALSVERGDVYEHKTAVSPVKAEPEYKTDRLEVAQSKMVIAYKTDITDYGVSRVFTALLGGTAFSMLFKSVREKLSLCYYCSSSVNRKKGVVLIDSGIENENIEAARNEIFRQVELAKNGEFTDELLEKTKLLLTCALKAVHDSPHSTADWYINQYLANEVITPEEAAEKMNAVTREQICQYAASLKLDSVYVLTGKESGND